MSSDVETKDADFQPLREVLPNAEFSGSDTLIVFGEVFQRGYVNGLIDEARRHGMKVIYTTVGRRTNDRELRPLTEEELSPKDQPLINVPLEAGFDLDPGKDGHPAPVDQLSDLRLSEWESAQLNWDWVEESRQHGVARFCSATEKFLQKIEPHLNPEGNLVFAHTMAGGFPRAKIVMPAANRVFKGVGDRFLSSEVFWKSSLGRLCEISFNEVTAETFRHLIELTTPLREKWQKRNKKISYLAYGYHGTEVLQDGQYRWQSYSPYLQGFAKKRLEDIARQAYQNGVGACVFNSPEILTDSSSIFLGVEVVLYPLIGALQKEGGKNPKVQDILAACQKLLKDEYTLDDVYEKTQSYLRHPTVKGWPSLKGWPQHNGPEQMELMRRYSSELIEMHRDPKQLMTALLSEAVFRACGRAMLAEAWAPRRPVWWIGHDLVARLAGTYRS